MQSVSSNNPNTQAEEYIHELKISVSYISLVYRDLNFKMVSVSEHGRTHLWNKDDTVLDDSSSVPFMMAESSFLESASEELQQQEDLLFAPAETTFHEVSFIFPTLP